MRQDKTQLILPMAGESRRFFEAGFKEPKPFFKINGRKMIDRVLEQFPPSWERFFVFNELMKPYAEEAKAYLPNARNLQFVEANNSGPLKSVEKALEIADPARPAFVSYCDYRMLWNPRNFEEFASHSRCDVAVITYRGFHPHYCTPNSYCYVRTDGDANPKSKTPTQIIGIKEKESFTDDRQKEHASTGGYYFRSAELLKRGLDLQKEMKLHYKGEYFTSFAVQALMQTNKRLKVLAYEVPYFFQWGTPEDVKAFEYWEHLFENDEKTNRVKIPDGEELSKVAPSYAKNLAEQADYFRKAFQITKLDTEFTI